MIPVVIGGTQYIRDFSGYARNGTPTAFAGTDVEYEDYCWGQCIAISNPKCVQFGSILDYTFQNFSFEIVFMANSIANSPNLVYKGPWQARGYYIQLWATGYIQLVTNQAGVSQQTQTSAGLFVAGQWYHVIVTRDGAIARIYKNGAETTYGMVGAHLNPVSTAESFSLGMYDAASDPLDGRVMRLRSWNRCLSAAESKERYQLVGRGV